MVISQLMKTELRQQEEIEKKALSRLARKTAKIRDNYLKKMAAKRDGSSGSSEPGKKNFLITNIFFIMFIFYGILSILCIHFEFFITNFRNFI